MTIRAFKTPPSPKKNLLVWTQRYQQLKGFPRHWWGMPIWVSTDYPKSLHIHHPHVSIKLTEKHHHYPLFRIIPIIIHSHVLERLRGKKQQQASNEWICIYQGIPLYRARERDWTRESETEREKTHALRCGESTTLTTRYGMMGSISWR